MFSNRPEPQTAKGRRWAIVAAALGLAALLGGCVVYPAYGPPHPYWHGGWHDGWR